MGSPYLNNNESIILSTHNVVINAVPAEAILTNQRLIIVDARHIQLRPQDIPFAAIETVTIGDNSAMDPVLSLSIVTKDEVRHPLGITFTQLPRTRRTGERDEWAVKLKEFSTTAEHGHGVQPADLLPPWVPGDLPKEAGDEPEMISPEEKFRNPPLMPRKPKTPAPGNRKVLLAGSIIVLVIVVALAGYYLAPSLLAKGGAPTGPVATPTATMPPSTPTVIQTGSETPVLIMTPTPSLASTPAVTAVPTTVVQNGIPPAGVWVRIMYAGNFSGSVGASGRMTAVTGSGDQLYPIAVKNEIVEAEVQKLDGSGNPLTVVFYNNGVVVKSGITSSPSGSLDLHADMRSAEPVTTTGNITAGNLSSGS